ncbi:MAG: FAD binding domain-containing protein [Phycisphaerae bacterium]|jgi:CO/xanthine dehydrogenase FAD-binding subunit
MQVLTPSTLDEALAMLAAGGTPPTPIAGGTDLLVSWHHKPKDGLRFLDLSRLTGELGDARLSPDELVLGALTTYWDVICSVEIASAFPLLAQAARQVGAVQIQTRGTWAGNIGNGSPAADGVPVLMAYDAAVVLQSVGGRREVPLDAYWTGYKQSVRRPEELIVAVRLPRGRRDFEWFHKVGSRTAQTISKVGVAAVHDDRGWRIAANSVAPFVCRCRNLERALDAGRAFANPDEVRAALAADISPIDDIRSTAEYRARVLSRLIYFALAAQSSAAVS